MRWSLLPGILATLAVVLSPLAAVAQQQPPNILVIMGDDIAIGTSAPTTAARWDTARPISTASPMKARS